MNKRPDPKVVDLACYEALSVLGIRRKYGVGTLAIDKNFMGWIGLNQGVHPTFVRVNPNIGIHCVPLMKLIGDAAGEKYQMGRWTTLSYPLGEACPKVKQFIFETEHDILHEATRLAEAINECGIPYMRSLASYSTMLPLIRKEIGCLGDAPERYAAALYLSGDIQGAFNFLNEQIATFVAGNLAIQAEKLNKLKLHLEQEINRVSVD